MPTKRTSSNSTLSGHTHQHELMLPHYNSSYNFPVNSPLLDFSSNNSSLTEIPDCVLNKSWDGKSISQSWRRLHFRKDNLTPGYDVHLLCDWTPDDGKKLDKSKTSMRASVHNVFNRSDKLIIYKPGFVEPLNGIDSREAKGYMCSRILRLTGWKSIGENTIRIYRLNHMFTFPDSIVKDLDCDHISKDNLWLRIRCQNENISLGDEWFKSSDDRIINNQLLSPPEHWFKHEKDKDGGYHGDFRFL